MTITRFLALLSVLALLAALPLAVVFAQGETPEDTPTPEAMTPEPTQASSERPVRPQRFYGMVTVDGEMAEAGTMVTAMAGEDKVGEGTVDDDGNYVLSTEGDLGNMEITFMIGEMAGMPSMADGTMVETVMWEGGEFTQLNLMAGEVPPTPAPTRLPVGPRGATGAQGEQGEQGEPGPAGPAGADGADGADGARGPVGPRGAAGSDGADGADGARGPAGPAGADGADGSDGARGPAGPAGPAGAAGQDGSQGPAGAQGASGGGGLAIVALIIAIVAVLAAGGAFMAGRGRG